MVYILHTFSGPFDSFYKRGDEVGSGMEQIHGPKMLILLSTRS